MPSFRSADSVLSELGVTEPQDIDIEAIAFYCGATVRYRPLDSCAARIIGIGDRAIISVNNNEKKWERQRFSIAHELGHWMRDRGQAIFCQEEDLRQPWNEHNNKNSESMANRYAANILMPASLFKEVVRDQAITFDSVFKLTELFQTSATTTAIRLVELGAFPGMVVCYNMSGRKWFKRGPDVSTELWPKKELSHDTKAFELLFGDKEYQKPITVDANDWIDHRDSYRYTVVEHAIKISRDTILVLLWWQDESQLLELR